VKILVACEESQEVCKAFRKLGHEAFSCDILDCSGGHPEWHIKGDVLEQLNNGWDIMIAHPPCTYLSKAGARWMYPTAGNIDNNRLKLAIKGKEFFMKLLNADIPLIVLENPTPLKVVGLPVPTQVIQPYEYGNPFSKRTLLWIKGLPKLQSTNVLTEYKPFMPSNTGGAKRGQKHNSGVVKNQIEASKTFPGIAKAMAEQWTTKPKVIQCTLSQNNNKEDGIHPTNKLVGILPKRL